MRLRLDLIFSLTVVAVRVSVLFLDPSCSSVTVVPCQMERLVLACMTAGESVAILPLIRVATIHMLIEALLFITVTIIVNVYLVPVFFLPLSRVRATEHLAAAGLGLVTKQVVGQGWSAVWGQRAILAVTIIVYRKLLSGTIMHATHTTPRELVLICLLHFNTLPALNPVASF